MREVFEEYGGIIAIAIIGLSVIAGLIEIMIYLYETGII